MSKLFITLGGAALLAAVGCSGGSPTSAGDGTAGEPAAKLTVSGSMAGGGREAGHGVRPPLTSSGTDAPSPQQARVYELRLDQTLQAGALQVTWLDLQDSRCPTGAQCIWAGEARVLLGVARERAETEEAELVLGDGGAAAAEARVHGYLFRLLAVAPYPSLAVPTERQDYVASVSIQRLQGRDGLTAAAEPAGGAGEPPEVDPSSGGSRDHAALLGELEAARARWEQAGMASYRFVFQRQCFCLQDYRRPALLTVEGDRITSAVYADGEGGPVSSEVQEFHLTVEGLFAAIETAAQAGAASIEAAFDPELGFPTHVYIDRDFAVTDEEAWYEAREVEMLE
ncbi:MAG: DUF6174 domain-containing protein [Candidatus Latescibacterota bacterium]